MIASSINFQLRQLYINQASYLFGVCNNWPTFECSNVFCLSKNNLEIDLYIVFENIIIMKYFVQVSVSNDQLRQFKLSFLRYEKMSF